MDWEKKEPCRRSGNRYEQQLEGGGGEEGRRRSSVKWDKFSMTYGKKEGGLMVLRGMRWDWWSGSGGRKRGGQKTGLC